MRKGCCTIICITFSQVGKGLLRVLRVNDNIADMVPVDMLNNVIISVGWMTGVNRPPQPIIYQYTSGTLNPVKWVELCKLYLVSGHPWDTTSWLLYRCGLLIQ